MEKNQETIADIIAEMRSRADEIERDCAEKMKRGEMTSDQFARELVANIRSEADRLEAARKREVDKLNSAIQATVGRSDAEIDRLRREIAELRQAGNAAKLREAVVEARRFVFAAAQGQRDILVNDKINEPYVIKAKDTLAKIDSALKREVATDENSSAVGNAAKLREAAEKTRATLEEALQILNGISDEEAGRLNARLEDVADAICEVTQWTIPDALAAPPRNCDVYNNESCRIAYHLHGDGVMTMQAFADWLFATATEQEGGAK